MFNTLYEYIHNSKDKLQYMGNCVSILDNEYFHSIASDATQLAQLVDGGERISFDRFAEIVETQPKIESLRTNKRYSLWYNKEKNVAWYLDELKDIEYFFASFK